MRFRFIEAEKADDPIRLLCRCLEVSRSGYDAWRERPVSAHTEQDARLKVEIAASHSASRRTYGSPRIIHDLREEGHRVSRKRVARLMRELGLEGAPAENAVSEPRRTRGTHSPWRPTCG